MAASTYELFFTGRDDPRDGCVVIGRDVKPVFLEFETSDNPTIRTTIQRNEQVVAAFDWTPGNHLGRCRIGAREIPMAQLVLPGSAPNARMFLSSDGRRFEWRRRLHDDPNSYDLFTAPNTRIAIFRRFAQLTPVGPSHGVLQYAFSHDLLLLEALLALCFNRWIDWRGM